MADGANVDAHRTVGRQSFLATEASLTEAVDLPSAIRSPRYVYFHDRR